jgi:hypothetical protein
MQVHFTHYAPPDHQELLMGSPVCIYIYQRLRILPQQSFTILDKWHANSNSEVLVPPWPTIPKYNFYLLS